MNLRGTKGKVIVISQSFLHFYFMERGLKKTDKGWFHAAFSSFKQLSKKCRKDKREEAATQKVEAAVEPGLKPSCSCQLSAGGAAIDAGTASLQLSRTQEFITLLLLLQLSPYQCGHIATDIAATF
ncbi:hypothetical protein H920_06551 [Fukomys damarensis]|uniref:Uncharacterized protein n=1 Tax=Fukomys damarensis TaxID=885580 RepID=A0A091DLK4_FUKDA|nr:hypothetical protein H920_06551 [Fukomys damarensis]